jgi:hypothetical protein
MTECTECTEDSWCYDCASNQEVKEAFGEE